MGALHEGHLSLIDVARSAADRVWVSVFVNPTQFGENEDLAAYPRDLERDVFLAGTRGADVVFAPTADQIYPMPQAVWVEPGPLGEPLCGASRPGHFQGVLTIVLKLFELVRPTIAVFGRKDLQQSVLIRRMVSDFLLPIDVMVAPIVREPDGLALSSRNVYLSPDERVRAAALARALRAARGAFASGQTDPAAIRDIIIAELEADDVRIDYAAIVEPDTLLAPETASDRCLCVIAGFIGRTRLIDNAPLGDPCEL